MISEVTVFVYLPGEVTAVPAGKLMLNQLGNELSSQFVYGRRYMQRPNAIELDPISLRFRDQPRAIDEQIVPANGLALFGAFRDATPDSWGRRVIEKKLKAYPLPEIEYITHSFDDRVGALDFRASPTAESKKHPFNRVLDLQYLLDCADKIDHDEPVPDDMLQMFHFGSSMGGARPKAVVEDQQGLWLAKFRARGDRFDYAKVEAATMRLAALCGIDVAEVRTESIGETNICLVKRFDRVKTDKGYTRLHYVSALTLLGKDESESPATGYVDILSAIMKYGPSHNAQAKEQLFRRMVFNILISNIDDHLRNHGFVYENGHYNLSKAYDLVPTPVVGHERYQHLYVGTQGKLSTLDNALSQAGLYGLGAQDANDIVHKMFETVDQWPSYFEQQGVSRRDIETIALAFRSAEQLWLQADRS
jgi:serine/threonine-protein kinase HipA